jgi:hypothetical protein
MGPVWCRRGGKTRCPSALNKGRVWSGAHTQQHCLCSEGAAAQAYLDHHHHLHTAGLPAVWDSGLVSPPAFVMAWHACGRQVTKRLRTKQHKRCESRCQPGRRRRRNRYIGDVARPRPMLLLAAAATGENSSCMGTHVPLPGLPWPFEMPSLSKLARRDSERGGEGAQSSSSGPRRRRSMPSGTIQGGWRNKREKGPKKCACVCALKGGGGI